MSMRPFMSYPEGRYAAHWLAIMGAVAVGYTLRTGGRAETSDAEELAHSPQA